MSRKAADIVVKDKGSKWDRSKAYGPEFVTEIMRHPGNGTHHTRELDVAKGKSRKPKHKKDWDKEASLSWTASLELFFKRNPPPPGREWSIEIVTSTQFKVLCNYCRTFIHAKEEDGFINVVGSNMDEVRYTQKIDADMQPEEVVKVLTTKLGFTGRSLVASLDVVFLDLLYR